MQAIAVKGQARPTRTQYKPRQQSQPAAGAFCSFGLSAAVGMAAVFRCVRMWLPIAPPPGWIDKQYKVGACNGPSRPTARVSSDSYRVGKAQVRYCGPVNPVITRIPTFVTFILELAFRWCAPERRGRSVGSVQGQCETLQAATRRKELPFSEDTIVFQASVSPHA